MSVLVALVAASAALPPICTERPGKANSVCTVPAGHAQIETGLADWSLTKISGSRTEFIALGASFVRFGLTKSSEIQIGLNPWNRTAVKSGGIQSRSQGFGDMIVRYKQRLTGENAPVKVGIIPFVKLPTAKHDLGNGKFEGGLAIPISFAFIGPVGMTLGPEVDVLTDADGRGHHAGLVNLINVGVPIVSNLTMSGEIWTNFNFDPSGTLKQASADTALAYAVSNDVQLDAGANFGLTRNTADVEINAGVSARF